MNELINEIKGLASALQPELSAIRRHLHTHPELSELEHATAAFIAQKLTAWGIPFQEGIADTGIVAEISCTHPQAGMIALRADMDALPIQEQNACAYRSQVAGVMHACGHDVHMTCLLGAAYILKKLQPKLKRPVRLIFQPSEEKFPGGAIRMIEQGVLEHPTPEAIIGQHVLPTLEAGKVGFLSGPYMASTDEVYLTIKGRGGHAATPELNIDPVVMAAQVVLALQQIVSRMAPPDIPTVLSFGRIFGDGRTNVIPDQVTLDGTLRTFSEEWRVQAHNKIRQVAEGITTSFGGSCEVRIAKGYPFLVNNDRVTAQSREAAISYLGADMVVELDRRMTAEDFAYFSQALPACFYRLGVKTPGSSEIRNLHTSRFDVDESCLSTGAGLMAWMAAR